MQTSWRQEAPALLLIVAMFAATATLWPAAPERLPVHWNLEGQVDRYGGKFEGLLLMPLMAVALYAMFLALPRIDPRRAAYASFARPYRIVQTVTIAFLAIIHAAILAVAFGYHLDIGLLVPGAVGVLFCVLGNFMGKFRPNWFVGVRTPWTLSSRESWAKTNRLGGRFFLVTGIAMFGYALVHNVWTLGVVLALIALMLIVLPVYSYVVWRQDGERAAASDSQLS